MKNKIWVEGNAVNEEVVTNVVKYMTNNGYELVTDLDSVDRVDILFNCSNTSDKCRDNSKFHYATIVTVLPENNANYKHIRTKRSDIYISPVQYNNETRYQIRNSELYIIYMNASLDKAVLEVVSQVESKLNRLYVSVVPDESPKDLTKSLSDNRKSSLLLKLSNCTSVSISTRNRPHNGLSTLMVYRNVKFSQNYPMILSYFDNVNGIIRYSTDSKEYSKVKIPLDIIAHQAIHQALSFLDDAVVMFNQFNLNDSTYVYGDNLIILEPQPINSVEYYKLIGICASTTMIEKEPCSILVPNRGVFHILPLTLTDDEIIERVTSGRKRATWETITETEV